MTDQEKIIIDTIAKKYSPRYSGRVYDKYSPAFITTNEDLFATFDAVNPRGKDVLTVCASGMHPLYAALFGAKSITSFDISHCAEYVLKMNIATIRNLSYEKYERFIRPAFRNNTVRGGKTFNIIRPNLDDGAQYFFDRMRNKEFINGDGYDEPTLPIKPDFLKMQKMPMNVIESPSAKAMGDKSSRAPDLTKPTGGGYSQPAPAGIEFIRTDIRDLHTHLTRPYDIIHFSNIFGYANADDKPKIVRNVAKFMNSDGTMIVQYAYGNRNRANNAVKELRHALPEFSFEVMTLDGGVAPSYLVVMHKRCK